MVLSTWIFGFGVLIITWFESWGRFGLDVAIGSCSILPDVNGRSPKEFLFVFAFLTPCIAIVVCYARIFYIVRKTASKSRNRNVTASTNVIEINNEVSVDLRCRFLHHENQFSFCPRRSELCKLFSLPSFLLTLTATENS